MDEVALRAAERVLPSFGVTATAVEPVSLSENIDAAEAVKHIPL